MSLSNHDNERQMPRVAVIGTGTMGTAMARRLLGAGMQLDVWSRHAASTEPLVDAGASASDRASDAVERADVVITMLPNAEVTTGVMIGGEVLGAMPPESMWVQMATIGADATERLAMEARTRRPDVTFVDAPVSGSRDPAEKGQLLILASGPPGAAKLLDPVFAALGRATLWLGPAGVGSRMKLALNTWLAFQVEGAAEVAALAAHLGDSWPPSAGRPSWEPPGVAVCAGEARQDARTGRPGRLLARPGPEGPRPGRRRSGPRHPPCRRRHRRAVARPHRHRRRRTRRERRPQGPRGDRIDSSRQPFSPCVRSSGGTGPVLMR